MCSSWSRNPWHRVGMTGLGLGLLIVLTCLSAQAQTTEERIERLERSMSQMTQALPTWRKRFEFDGDLRLRYQYEDTTGEAERHRGRFRYRLAVTATITDQLKTVFGLASGSSDPRSTNQTFEDSFSSKPVQIDLAYAQYQPIKVIKLVGGKFKNPIWLPSDLLWDSDINPEGGAVQLDFATAIGLDILFNTGIFVIDENSGGGDPLVIPIQGGISYAFNKQVDFQLAVTYYSFVDVEGSALEFSEQFAGVGNTLVDDVLMFDYDSISVGAEVGFNKLLGEIMPYIGLFGEYVYNFDPDDDNEGYLGGIKIGHRQVSEGGQWQATFLYRYLERDAWLDTFPDSDFLGGSTNGEGYEIIVSYGVNKYVTLGMDYYHSEQIDGDADQELLQLDVVLKF
jgi:hypothetical protein